MYKNGFVKEDGRGEFSNRLKIEALNVAQGPHLTELTFEFHCTGDCNAVEQYISRIS